MRTKPTGKCQECGREVALDTMTTIIKFNPTAFLKVCGGCFERSLNDTVSK